MLRDRMHSEDGMGLIVAMLVTLMVGGMVVVFMNRSLTETQLSSSARDREAALHVAEAGIDAVVIAVNSDDDHITTKASDGTPHAIDLSTYTTLEQEKSWALQAAQDCVLVATDIGEACGIRPTDGTEPLGWIYGVGFVPDRANAEKTRVIKVQYDKGFFSPDKAIVTNGDLTFNGQICGDAAGVHSNEDVTVGGNGDTTTCAEPDGNVTSTGTFTPGGSIGSDSGQVNRTESIPKISAAAVYVREAAREAARDAWYDLCPTNGGEVRAPLVDSATGELVLDASGQPQPCAGDLLFDSADAATFLGWSYQPSQNTWDVTTALIPDGVYYIYEADAKIRGDVSANVNMSVLADGAGTISGQPDSGTGCTMSGGNNGNIRFAGVGNGTYNPYLQDLLFLADRDLQGQGNSKVTINGVLLAHEQVDFGGTVTFTGAVVAEGACDSAGSPVGAGANRVTGNFQLTHAGEHALPLDSITRITAWNEL